MLACGVSFAVPQFLISNFINPWIVDIGASLVSMACLIGFLKFWQPKEIWTSPALRRRDDSAATMPKPPAPGPKPSSAEVWAAFLPWIIVCAILLIWGTGAFKALVNPFATWNYPVPALHNMINQVPPVAAQPKPESAVFAFTWLSYTGPGCRSLPSSPASSWGSHRSDWSRPMAKRSRCASIRSSRSSAMLAIGTLTRLSGVDATLGLAFAGAGVLYPFFGTLLGWLGVALTGSDTASNILFGNLQKITSEQLGLSPI